ncbi:MAG TPA: hypothetical protein VFD43_13380, partial [Planctomycetota bacterium]|nr:hypothetical protein [Planctomycetota bacterium]
MLTRTHWCVLGCMIVQAGWLAAAAQSPGQAVLPPIAERAPEPLASPAQPASAEWLAPYVGHFESGGGFTGVALEIRPDGG